MTTICPICNKEWDYHSETESSSCGKKLCLRITESLNDIEELELK